jgi:hypothetical protein
MANVSKASFRALNDLKASFMTRDTATGEPSSQQHHQSHPSEWPEEGGNVTFTA